MEHAWHLQGKILATEIPASEAQDEYKGLWGNGCRGYSGTAPFQT